MGSVQIPLSKGKFATIDEEDLEVVSQFAWCANISAGGKCYAISRRHPELGRGVWWMHRVIFAAADPSRVVDHINGDGLDNRRENLRQCTPAENSRNKPKTKGSSRFKGVSRHPKNKSRPWHASISIEGRARWLGNFATEKDAARAYNAAAVASYGEFARINAIEGLSYDESITAPTRNHHVGRRGERAGAAA